MSARHSGCVDNKLSHPPPDTNGWGVVVVLYERTLLLESSPVLQAQTAGLMLALRQYGMPVSLVCTVSDEPLFWAAAGNRLRDAGVQVETVSSTGWISDAWRVAKHIAVWARRQSQTSVYVRSVWAALLVRLVGIGGSVRYVYDARGDLLDESIQRNGTSRIRHVLLALAERLAVRHASAVTCVSTDLARKIASRCRLRQMPTVVPSCVNPAEFTCSPQDRLRLRAELGFSDDDVVLAYSGGLSEYQRIPDMLALWGELLDRDRSLKCLLMIGGSEATDSRISDFGRRYADRVRTLSLLRSEVGRVLCCGDVGFLLREQRPLNSAASPVKFAEYLAAGLAVVTSPGVGDASDVVIRENVGALVVASDRNPDYRAVLALLTHLRSNRECLRTRCREVAQSKFSWNAHVPALCNGLKSQLAD